MFPSRAVDLLDFDESHGGGNGAGTGKISGWTVAMISSTDHHLVII